MSDSYGTQRWVSFYNDSGLVIPSYALIMLVSDKGTTSSTKNFCKRLRARQYTSGGTGQFSDQGIYAFNSRSPVEPETYGKCNFAVDGPAWARIKDVDVDGTDLNEDTDWLGKEYGPINEKWSIGPDGSGYALLSRPKQLDGASYHRVLVMKKPEPSLVLLKYTSTDHLMGAVDGDGIEATGTCESVDAPGTTLNCTASITFRGLILPQMRFWGQKRSDGKYHVVYGGVHMLTGPCTGDGETTITVAGIDVQFFNPCSQYYAEGQYLTLGVTYGTASDNSVGLVVLNDCCPPDEG